MKLYFLFTTQHVYPWDYKVSELPRYWCNFSIPFLDFFAWLGWATDLKTVSDEMIRKRVLRTGDGTHRYAKEKITAKELVDTFNNNNDGETDEHVDTLWGWGKIHLAFSSTRNWLSFYSQVTTTWMKRRGRTLKLLIPNSVHESFAPDSVLRIEKYLSAWINWNKKVSKSSSS